MHKFGTIFLIITLLLFFTIASEAILSVKMRELKLELSKSQMMNYEFSSQALRKKFKLMLVENISIKEELLNSSLDSYVMNSKLEEKKEELNNFEIFGLGIVNTIRKLSFKPFLNLQNNQRSIIRLQYAFYLEKNQKFKEALSLYNELENDSTIEPGNDSSFVLLHGAYCDALLGNRIEAITKLEKVISSQPGSHFADSAQILIEVLNDISAKTQRIENKNLTEEEKIDAYFSSGMYLKSLELLNTKENLNLKQEFQKARSLEKTGEVETSISIYKKLVNQKEDPEIAKKANRRLLLIGLAYEGGEEVSKFAEQKAIAMNDTETIIQVKESLELQKKSVILENIEKFKENQKTSNSDNEDSPISDSFSKIESNLAESLKSQEKALQSIEKNIIENDNSPKFIKIELVDGRIYRGSLLIRNEEELTLNLGKIDISFPISLVKKIDTETKSKKPIYLNVIMNSKDLNRVSSIQRNNKDFTVTKQKLKNKINFNEIISISLDNF